MAMVIVMMMLPLLLQTDPFDPAETAAVAASAPSIRFIHSAVGALSFFLEKLFLLFSFHFFLSSPPPPLLSPTARPLVPELSSDTLSASPLFPFLLSGSQTEFGHH